VPFIENSNSMSTWCGSTPAPISGWRSSPARRSGMCPRTLRPIARSTRPGGGLPATIRVRPRSCPCRAAACTCRAPLGVARFSFHDLCEQPLSAVDYLRIAHEYHTVILDHVPTMTYDNRNAAKRFIILIDTLYDMNVKLIASRPPSPTRSTRRRRF